MEKIIITSRKILFAKWNNEHKKWDKTDITKSDKPLAFYFPHVVELGEGVTIEDILRHLEGFSDQVSSVFSGYLENCSLKDLLLELEKEPTEDLVDKLDCIELYWNINLIPMNDSNVNYRLNKFPSIRGVIVDEVENTSDNEYDDDFSEEIGSLIFEEFLDMSLTPLKNFKNITLVINDVAEFIDPKEDFENYMQESIMNVSLEWNFFTLISCILTELSLYGTPKEQEKVIEEIVSENNTPQILEAVAFFEYLDEN